MRLNLFYILCIFITTFACKEKDTCSDNSAFFGGEIVNPYSNYIVLKKSKKVIDTITLNPKNRFLYKIDNVEPGLYHFFDGREIQAALIQPKDSLMLRLNTYDFDESLVYTGIGAKENNYLMELFLLNENEEKNKLELYQLNPNEFEKKIDSLRYQKLEKLNTFKLNNKTSTLFNALAEANINYKHYATKEVYPVANYTKSEKEVFNSLPKDFYNYRKKIDYNDTLLKDYSPYNTFLHFHLSNMALQKHFLHSKDTVYNKFSVDYNLDKLKLIDEKIKDEYIKNRLLNHTMVRFINISKNTKNYDTLLSSFKAKSTNKEHINKAETLVNTYKRLKFGNTIPEVIVLDAKDNALKLNKLISKNTVIYFWTKKNRNHLIEAHKRIKELNVKYPEINFMAINIDNISHKTLTKTLRNFNVRIHNEYRLKHPEKAIDLLYIKPINNVYIVNKKQQIVNAKANVFSINFEQELLALINTN